VRNGDQSIIYMSVPQSPNGLFLKTAAHAHIRRIQLDSASRRQLTLALAKHEAWRSLTRPIRLTRLARDVLIMGPQRALTSRLNNHTARDYQTWTKAYMAVNDADRAHVKSVIARWPQPPRFAVVIENLK